MKRMAARSSFVFFQAVLETGMSCQVIIRKNNHSKPIIKDLLHYKKLATFKKVKLVQNEHSFSNGDLKAPD